jgi:hypothetical protein
MQLEVLDVFLPLLMNASTQGGTSIAQVLSAALRTRSLARSPSFHEHSPALTLSQRCLDSTAGLALWWPFAPASCLTIRPGSNALGYAAVALLAPPAGSTLAVPSAMAGVTHTTDSTPPRSCVMPTPEDSTSLAYVGIHNRVSKPERVRGHILWGNSSNIILHDPDDDGDGTCSSDCDCSGPGPGPDNDNDNDGSSSDDVSAPLALPQPQFQHDRLHST